MATSQNGWGVYSSAPPARLKWITGRVRPGDVHTIFDYLCKRFDAEVENIVVGHSWGWAFRAVRGSQHGYSNHASGTAIDLNAPAHPLGKSGTFSSADKARIHAILKDLDGVVRWGGDYSGRKDEMHFEINAGSAAVSRVADKIKGGKVGRKPSKPKAWKWNPDVVSDLALVQQQFQIAAGVRKGTKKRYHGVAAIQNALNVKFLPKSKQLDVDGYVGEATLDAMRAYERKNGGTGRATTPDPESLGGGGLQIMYRFKGPEAK